ncbi:hypothetical protein RhiLY_08839 [Ceratobasidium sp. AG-Ba]|nr:hypothetical protein RhiLY_08839 [Ceratobasidium sp. AG-Ba]
MCDGINFVDPCGYPAVPDGCLNLPEAWSNMISSFEPPNGTACLLWSDPDCQGSNPGGWMVNPGSADLRSLGFNDRTVSIQCKDE